MTGLLARRLTSAAGGMVRARAGTRTTTWLGFRIVNLEITLISVVLYIKQDNRNPDHMKKMVGELDYCFGGVKR